MTSKPRVSPWIKKETWTEAQKRAESEEGVKFADIMAWLVRAYADGVIDIDPRMIPKTDNSRAGRAVFPFPEDWREAKDRAWREHGISGSAMMECLVLRYKLGHLNLKPTGGIIEVQKLESPEGRAFRGLRGVSLKVANALAERSDQTMKDIAVSAACSISAASRALQSLEESGLVVQATSTGSAATWKLTPKATEDSGQAEVRRVSRPWNQKMGTFRGLRGVNLKVANALAEKQNQTIEEIMVSAQCSKAGAFHGTQYLARHGFAVRTGDTWARTSKTYEEVRPLGVEGVKLKVACALAEKSDQTVKEVAVSAACSISAADSALRYLEDRGFAVRTSAVRVGATWALTPEALAEVSEAMGDGSVRGSTQAGRDGDASRC
ncbi:hypothetical protein ACFV42_48200 [Streptomyces solisilvae]|uniref:hypothetical protein n=1 Tax=Streptomyces malaysiensis TaxID=92644 RepID=UPI00369626CD